MHHPEPMDAQCKKMIWREWAQGTPMSLIARLIQKPPATVFSYLRDPVAFGPDRGTAYGLALWGRARRDLKRPYGTTEPARPSPEHGATLAPPEEP